MIKERKKFSFKTKKMSMKKMVLVIILFLVCLSMIPWAINSYSNNNLSDDNWVQVGDKVVKSNVILSEYNNFIRQYYTYIQQNPFLLVQQLNNIISGQISSLILASEAEKIKLGVDEKVILDLAAKIPAFQDSEGKFDRNIFREKVNAVNGSEQAFLDTLNDMLLQAQLTDAIYPNIVHSSEVSKLDYIAINQVRNVSYIEILPSSFPAIKGQPTNEELTQLRDSNKPAYTVPELRSADVVFVPISELPKVVASEKEINAYYNNNKNNYLNPESRNVSQINFDNEDDAKKAFAKIKSLKIEEIKKQATVVDLGKIEPQDLPEDLSSAIFKAPINKPTAPVKSSFGWHIFIINSINAPKAKDLKEVKSEIEQELLAQKQTDNKENLRNKLLELSSQNIAFAEIAKKSGAKYYTLKDISQNDINTPNSPVHNNQDIINTVFSATLDTSSGLLEDKDGNFYISKVTNITPERIKEISEIKGTLTAIWKENKMTVALTEATSKLMLDLSNKKSISKLGYPVKTINLSLAKNDHPFSPEAINLLFSERKNKPIEGKLANGNNFVALVNKITVNNVTNKNKKEIDSFNEFMKKNFVETFMGIYTSSLEKDYKVKVNEQAIIDTLTPQKEQ